MALEGSLTDFGLADILQLICFQRKSGVLTLESNLDRVILLFRDGNIAGASSKKRLEDNRLGKILVKKGIVTEADLSSALEEQKKTGLRLGQVLARREPARKELISDILISQITETVIQLFDWKQGTYEFIAQTPPADSDFAFSIDTQHVLMEGLRISDEWTLIKGKITLESVFTKNFEARGGLTPDEEEVLSYVDGENDVSTIIDLSGRDNFQVSSILIGLMEKGLINASEPVPVVAAPEAAEKKGIGSLVLVLVPALLVAALVLSLAVFSQTLPRRDFRNFSAAKKIAELRFRLELYNIRHGAYPAALDAVSPEKDPWGQSFVYRPSERAFSLVSAGPDGKEGTVDDIF